MPGLLIVFGTTEGQTRRIAERMAEEARLCGFAVELHDATHLPPGLDPGSFEAVIVAGSVHVGRHQTSVSHFVHDHLASLQRLPSALVSVSLAAAGDGEDRADAQDCADRFLRETGWRPAAVHLAAGAFRYTQYDFFKRWMMKRIAREKGQPTDTSRDHEYTDWEALARFVDGFLATARPPAGQMVTGR